MKKLFLILIIFTLSLPLYARIKIFSCPIKEENIYIVEDKLDILNSKDDAKIYIKKAFIYMILHVIDDDFYHDILEKKEEYSVQVFTRMDGNKKIVYLNFFILDDKEDCFSTEEVIVFDGGTDFWNISYDIEKEEFYNLWVNGVA